jgi:hypothetical protein
MGAPLQPSELEGVDLCVDPSARPLLSLRAKRSNLLHSSAEIATSP